jgi:hypothetical protein
MDKSGSSPENHRNPEQKRVAKLRKKRHSRFPRRGIIKSDRIQTSVCVRKLYHEAGIIPRSLEECTTFLINPYAPGSNRSYPHYQPLA